MVPIYHIKKRPGSARLFPLSKSAWQSAEVAPIHSFLPQSMARPLSTAQMLYDTNGIWGRFNVTERFVRCQHLEFQQPVYRDAAVEFFVKPHNARGYFNFEFNICGAMLASYVLNPEKDIHGNPKQTIPLTLKDARTIKIKAPFKEPVDPEIPEALNWHLEFFIPFSVLLKFVPQMKIPEVGSVWKGNFYKCAEDNTHPHWAAWAPVPELNFHLPQYFGSLVFE
jgi:hypothetical protein